MILKQIKQNGVDVLVTILIVAALISVPMFLGTTARYIQMPANGTPLFNTIFAWLSHGGISVSTQIISILLVFGEALLVGLLNARFELSRAKAPFFVLVYVIISLSYIPFDTLLPEQVANVFIIWGLIKVLSSHGVDKAEFQFFDAGLLFGMASLVCTSANIMLIIGLIALTIYRPYKFSEFAVYVIGFAAPHIFYLSLYFIAEGSLDTLELFYVQKLAAGLQYQVSVNEMITFVPKILLILMASVLILQEYPKYNLFESRTYRMFFFMFLLTVVLTATPYINIQAFRIAALPVTMLFVTVFYELKHKIFSEIYFTLFLIVYIGCQYLWYRM